MKKIFTALAILSLTTAAFANGYCDGKPTQRERDRCNEVNSRSGGADPLVGIKVLQARRVFDTNLTFLNPSPKLSNKQKSSFEAKFAAFDRNGLAGCNGDANCQIHKYNAFNILIIGQYKSMIAN